MYTPWLGSSVFKTRPAEIIQDASEVLATSLLAAAAAAQFLQSCPTLCDPIDGRPPGSPSLEFSRQEHWSGLPFPSPVHKSESEVAQSCLTLATPWTAAYQAPPPMGFSRQEYWSGVPVPSPRRAH